MNSETDFQLSIAPNPIAPSVPLVTKSPSSVWLENVLTVMLGEDVDDMDNDKPKLPLDSREVFQYRIAKAPVQTTNSPTHPSNNREHPKRERKKPDFCQPDIWGKEEANIKYGPTCLRKFTFVQTFIRQCSLWRSQS